MLRQFGVPRPWAPYRPWLGTSNTDVPLIPVKPAENPRDLRYAAMYQTAVPYYHMLPKAFDVMQSLPAGHPGRRLRWPTASIVSDLDEKSPRKNVNTRRRTTSAPAGPRGRQDGQDRGSCFSSAESGTEGDSTPSTAVSYPDSRYSRNSKGKQTTRSSHGMPKPHGKIKISMRARRKSPQSAFHKRRRAKPVSQVSAYYTPLFPQPGGQLRFRDIPPNVPIHQMQPMPSLAIPQDAIQTTACPVASSWHTPRQIVQVSHIMRCIGQPCSSCQPMAFDARAYLQAESKTLETKQRVNERAWKIPGQSQCEQGDLMPVESGPSRNTSSERILALAHQAVRNHGLPSSANISFPVPTAVTGLDEDSHGEMAAEVLRAMAKSATKARKWAKLLEAQQQEVPQEEPWSFDGRSWHIGTLHLSSLPHCPIMMTYADRSDGETQSFLIDQRDPRLIPSVARDVRAFKSACKPAKPLESQIAAGVPAIVRFSWDIDTAAPMRIVTDLLLLGRLKRGKAYISQHKPKPRRADGESEPPTEGFAGRWRWPLQSSPGFARWNIAAAVDKLEIAFRPSCPDTEMYPLRGQHA